jgi:hypothetical protein
MPAMPRVNNKMRKIAYKILGVPENQKKATVYSEMPSNRDRSGVDELVDIKRVIPQNYF